jgi:hypothetical protein
MSGIAAKLASLIILPDRREIWDWAAENIDFGSTEAFKGRYSVENTPWTREILRCFRSPRVREITAIMPPQESGKTLAAQICLAWRAVNWPAKMQFNTETDGKAAQFSDTKFNQTIKACRVLRERFSENRHETTKLRIIFRDGSFLIIQGVEAPGNRQSDSIEVQINDEVHLWETPFLAQMHSRQRAFRDTRKTINISLGGNVGSELEERFRAGNQLEWSHPCPTCGKLFQYVFDRRNPASNIHFDLSKARLRDNGSLDLTEFAPTVHVTCPHCKARIDWSDDLMARLNAAGQYVAKNPDANPEIVSMHVNAFAIGRRPWVQILEPWVKMTMRGGVFAMEQLQRFINEELVEFWEDRPIIVNEALTLGSYTRAEMRKPGAWAKEWIRVMTIDNQQGKHGDIPHRWFAARALSKDGESRLIDCGRLNEWDQVRAKQRELSIPDCTPELPGPWVGADRAHDPTAVDEICASYQWYGMLGQDTTEFPHGPQSFHDGKRLLFSEQRTIDTGFGTAEAGRTYALYYLWSSQRVQDLLARLRQTPDQWQLPSDIMEWCPEYADHINSHRQKSEVKPSGAQKLTWYCVSGHPDHLYDCESMIVVLMLMAGVLKPE